MQDFTACSQQPLLENVGVGCHARCALEDAGKMRDIQSY